MSGNVKDCVLCFSSLVAMLWVEVAQAAEVLPEITGVGSVGTSVPTLPVPRSLPIINPSSSTLDPSVVEGGQMPGVLREIGQRQTELTILELDLKRAELQKKLRELEAAVPANIPHPLPAVVAQNSAVPSAVPDGAWETQMGPLVRRIHKIAGELVALVVFPGGETKNVRLGGLVGGGVRIVEILPDAVFVRLGDQQRYSLPVIQSRR